MAEQIPLGVATSLMNTLASLAFKEIASLYGVESDIEWLKKTVEGVKAVLADADKRQNTNELIQLWIRDLKEVLYISDDLLDEVHAMHLLHKRDSKGKVREFFSSSNPLAFRHKIARKVRNIREMFNDVAERMSKLNLDRTVVVEMIREKRNWRETSSKAEEYIIGREENVKEVIDLLLNDKNNNEIVSLVVIVGIGGLGKTSLAQLVYRNAKANKLFDKLMWVCVSEDFDVTTLVKKILESSTGNEVKDQQLELLQNKLEENLNGERYLLVLDDVWNEDGDTWSVLKKYLMCGAKGSKILVTTRNQTVASKMGVKTPYLLKGLKNDQSWALLKRLAFDDDQIVTQKLEDTGRKIVETCAGVPLAIRVLGSLLYPKARESDWEAILKGDFWKLCEDNSSIMPILKLSYDSLSIELKQCFAYCSLYPKDWRYEKKELIDLWMAQGFLGYKGEEQCPEDVGEDYVRILLMKSFLQDVETDELGKIKYFKMHDLMHDLSQSIANSYCYVHGRKNAAKFPMHASFEYYNPDDSLNKLDSSRLRTFLEIKKNYRRNPLHLLVLKRLRSLDLSGYEMSDLPESIGKMRHLRYLDMSSCHQLTCLPKSIAKLVHLETLKLEDCPKLKCPFDIITKLINLRKLEIRWWIYCGDGMPLGLCRMTNLQTLPYFIVGNDDKGRKKAQLNELKELNLKGKLVIQNLGLVREVLESKDVNLRTKENLVSLTLDWGEVLEVGNCDAVQLLENLCPHPNLKELKINSYPGACLSHWLLSCTNLVQLKLCGIQNCRYLAAGLEAFVSLKNFTMQGMEKLEYIYYNGYSSSTTFFPSLQQLEIHWCKSLRGWEKEENVEDTSNHEYHHSLPQFSRLSSLTIDGCPNLSCLPTFPNLVSELRLVETSTKPLVDTVNMNVRRIGQSTSQDHITPSLSMLQYLRISGIEMESLPEEWMRNLSSLQHLCIEGISSSEKPIRHLQFLSAALEEVTFHSLDSWCGIEDYNVQFQHQCFLHSLQRIEISYCDHLEALPAWICDLQNLQSIIISHCPKLVSFPKGMCRLTNLQILTVYHGAPLLKERCEREKGDDWPKIAHFPSISINHSRI